MKTRLLLLLTLALAVLSLASCALNPETGEREFVLPALNVKFKGPLTGSTYNLDTKTGELELESIGSEFDLPPGVTIEAQK